MGKAGGFRLLFGQKISLPMARKRTAGAVAASGDAEREAFEEQT
jgi:hypothetical protein